MGPMCFTALQCTWGAPQTLLGLPVFLAGRARGWPVRRYGGAVVSAWGGSSGMSLGLFVFVPALRRWRQRTGFGYYRFYTERWADAWAAQAPKTT